jgi:hypothetical protein
MITSNHAPKAKPSHTAVGGIIVVKHLTKNENGGAAPLVKSGLGTLINWCGDWDLRATSAVRLSFTQGMGVCGAPWGLFGGF